MKWLEIKYIGYIKDTNTIIDYTKNPVVVPIGKGVLYSFLEKALENVEIGKTYVFTFVRPFGERRDDLIKIIPLSEFVKRNIKPFPGLIVNVDGIRGTVRSVSGGRVIVDFNHPLAGKDLIYEIDVIREVDKLEDKIRGFIEFLFGISKDKVAIDIEGTKMKITVDNNPLIDEQKEILKNYIDELKNYEIL